MQEYESYSNNIEIMRRIASTTPNLFSKFKDAAAEMEKRLMSQEFEAKVLAEAERLAPICFFIDFAQRAGATLAEVYDEWLTLRQKGDWEKEWFSRDKMVGELTTLVAYTLDPRFKGTRLSKEQMQQVDQKMLRLLRESADLQSYTDFKESRGVFGHENLRTLSAETFWKLVEPSHEKLSAIAMKYTTLPASTASLERLFSQWKIVHSDSRNRMSTERSHKAAAVYHHLRSNLNNNRL